MISRRHFIKNGLGGLLGGLLYPPLTAAAKPYEINLTASHGDYSFGEDRSATSAVMHYNQSLPGPLLRLPQGELSTIRFHNALDESSSVHWHGLRIDNAMDGVPGMTQAAVEPGASFAYRLRPPDAGTYWYHSHSRSWVQRALGLAGVLIVEEPDPPEVDQDLVFAIDDWRLDQAMQLDSASLGSLHDWSHAGRLGNFITVNGESNHAISVSQGERIRLRLVNIANSRNLHLLFNHPDISIVAIDGQPVQPFAPDSGRIRLAPGQRSDLMIDMMADPGHRSPIELVIGEYAYEVAEFKYRSRVKRKQPLDAPIDLPDNPQQRILLPRQFEHVPLVMQGGAMGGMRSAIFEGRTMDMRELVSHKMAWAINGIAGLPPEPLFRVPRGTAVSLDVNNDNNWPHAMHLHGHHFIYDKNPGWWRDTVLIERGEQGAMQFVADNPGKWLVHCHMVEHMAAGMLTWFEVT